MMRPRALTLAAYNRDTTRGERYIISNRSRPTTLVFVDHPRKSSYATRGTFRARKPRGKNRWLQRSTEKWDMRNSIKKKKQSHYINSRMHREKLESGLAALGFETRLAFKVGGCITGRKDAAGQEDASVARLAALRREKRSNG